jgi:hypothetical protein
MLLSKVVVGRGYKMTSPDFTLTKPPPGYDSVSVDIKIVVCQSLITNRQVLAEAGPIGLNYDELVVYNNDAIRPSYLVMYDKPE